MHDFNGKPETDFNNKHVLVVGLAATGISTARVLHHLGARVTIADAKPIEGVDSERVREARALPGVQLELGNPNPDLSDVDLVIPSPGVPRTAPVLQNALDLDVPICSEIEVAYRIARAPIIAVTGTNGKTTTVALIGAICREAGLRTWVAGNIAEDAGVRLPLIEAAQDAPENGIIVAEISSFQLEWVQAFRPKVGVWLNLSADHQDRYDNMDDYARAKANLFQAQTPDDWAVVNDEDAAVLAFTEGVGEGRRIRFGLSRQVWADADKADHEHPACAYLDGQALTAENISPDAQIELICGTRDIPIPGKHNIANVLAASAACLAFGIDLASVRAGIRHFKGVAHRMELVATLDGVRFINNSMCTNPAAAAASLEAAHAPVIAIAGGKHKGGDLTPMTDALNRYARHVVLIGASAQEIGDLLGYAKVTWEIAPTLPDAVRRAARQARTGDTVLLVPGCASFDMFTSFEQRGQVFRDSVRALSEGELR